MSAAEVRTDAGGQTWEGTLDEFEAANLDAPDLVARVRALLPGQSCQGGGGDGPVFRVTRLEQVGPRPEDFHLPLLRQIGFIRRAPSGAGLLRHHANQLALQAHRAGLKEVETSALLRAAIDLRQRAEALETEMQALGAGERR